MVPQGEADSGSFRDRDGRVFLHGERVFRGLSAPGMDSYRQVSESAFFKQLVSDGQLVNSREIEAENTPLGNEICQSWAGFLEHEKLPLISYPYEWTFSMLRDAALLQLDITRKAVEAGFTLKDATPYNIQFLNGRPVFIDIASFEPLQKGAVWSGYRQFCEMFLVPLMLQAYRGLDFQPFLRSRIEGIPVQDAIRLLGFQDRFRKGVMTHVWLQSKLENRYAGSGKNVRGALKSAGFGKELILANLGKLTRLVKSLQWRGAKSEWADYEKFHNYSSRDHLAKQQVIERLARESRAETVWDIGCNTGRFSKLAAKHCRYVLACDVDHMALERLYLDPQRPGNILPLLQNVSDPSPDWGWRNRERTSLGTRNSPDLIMCLAVVHHVVITANVPMSEFVAWLASLAPKLIIEFVSRDDDKVKALLLNREDKYSDYSQTSLEQELARFYQVEEVIPLSDGTRKLYACKRLG